MKKLLYVAALPIDKFKPNGVQKKILSHVKNFERYFDTYLLCYFNGSVILSHNSEISIIKKGNNGYAVLNSITRIGINFDCYYIRYPKSSPYFIRFLKKIKNRNGIVVVEIPTYPYFSEGHETFVGNIQKIVDKIYRSKLKKYVDRIVTYSDDIEIFGIKTIRTINGIDFDSTPISKTINYKSDYHFIAVSNMYDINGYERLIKGLRNYYKDSPKKRVFFDIVGDGPSRKKYEQIVKEYELNEYVRFYGLKFGDDLNMVYDLAVVGVNSLAIHRHNLKFESTLKSKEYGAKGLIILSSSIIDSFSTYGNERFVIKVSPDDSIIDVNAVVERVDTILSQSNSPNDIKEIIRHEAFNVCDMTRTLKPIIEYLGGDI